MQHKINQNLKGDSKILGDRELKKNEKIIILPRNR